jgi:hypothetical protein
MKVNSASCWSRLYRYITMHGPQNITLKASIVRPGLKLFVVCEGLISRYASSERTDVERHKLTSACGNEREHCRMNHL